jgi:hypothetical protein
MGMASRPRTDERSSGTKEASMTTVRSGANERASSMELAAFPKRDLIGQLYCFYFVVQPPVDKSMLAGRL